MAYLMGITVVGWPSWRCALLSSSVAENCDARRSLFLHMLQMVTTCTASPTSSCVCHRIAWTTFAGVGCHMITIQQNSGHRPLTFVATQPQQLCATRTMQYWDVVARWSWKFRCNAQIIVYGARLSLSTLRLSNSVIMLSYATCKQFQFIETAVVPATAFTAASLVCTNSIVQPDLTTGPASSSDHNFIHNLSDWSMCKWFNPKMLLFHLVRCSST